jgi:tetratricopeptide (TPR) repeat protein
MPDLNDRKLEEINKLIFVRQYPAASKLLEDLIGSEKGDASILVHLRRIELSLLLNRLDKVRNDYAEAVRKDPSDTTSRICVAFCDQQGEATSPKESIEIFQDIMKETGPNAACYYGIGFAMEAQENVDRAIFNYEQALTIDQNWYLCFFGLSQIFYQKGDERRGDHYFFMFEKYAPYNVYGNFETHRDLCADFLDREKFVEAEAAIQTLSEWWIDNKGRCPSEIQIYELLATAKIAEVQGDSQQAEARRIKAEAVAVQVVEDPESSEGVLYFVAKVLEEFSVNELAFAYYRAILRREGSNSVMIQRIGSQFLSTGEYENAKQLFDEAYEVQPDNSDIRFCRLMAGLKLANVNVEEYLIGRERLKQLVENSGDKVELLALLHSMMAKFDHDPEVQGHVADVYLRLGNVDRAARHYDKMFEIDGKCQATALKYAAFTMQYRDPDEAMNVLDEVNTRVLQTPEDKAEMDWLRANYFARRSEFNKSNEYLNRVLKIDPWNVSYIIQHIINLTHLASIDPEYKVVDKVLSSVNSADDADIDWNSFDERSTELYGLHAYELVYARRKLRFLYTSGVGHDLTDLVEAASSFDANKGAFEFMKLLNTNFDGETIYWALGTLYKDLWQLETASMWFEQVLMNEPLSNDMKGRAYLELADCYIWQNRNIEKAIQYAKLAIDIGETQDVRAIRVLAHAFLKSGQVRQAKIYLDQTNSESDHEARYLNGLLHYRNGAHKDANNVWKPLLTVRTKNLRFHNIKQEILRFYFDGEPYMEAN